MINTEKELKKDEKNKKESAIVNGIQYDNVVENQKIAGKTVIYNQKTFINNCTSKAATRIYLQYDSAINNSKIESTLDLGGYYYYVYNSTLNCKIIFDIGPTKFYIDENTVIGENFSVSNTTHLVTNNTQVLEYIEKENTPKYILIDEMEYMLLENKDYYDTFEVYNNTFFNNCTFNWYTHDLTVNQPTIINNSQVNFDIYNENQLIITNSVLNGDLSNSGTLIIDDNTTIGERFNYNTIGTIQTNNTAIIEYLKNKGIFVGNHIIENQVMEGEFDNLGNLTIRNSTINYSRYIFDNEGNLTIDYSTINIPIRNFGNLTIADDVIFGENCSFTGNGTYNISNISRIIPYINAFYEEYNINNLTLNKNISNHGILSFSNSTLNSNIYNDGILIISDDTLIGENFRLTGDGDVIINDTNRIFEYQEVIKINMTFEDRNISFNKTFYGDTIFTNCNITEIINNKGNMTFINCSFSNNNMTTSNIYSNQYRVFLLDNQGTARLENCIIDNNTLNYTKGTSGEANLALYGAILNNGTMTILNTNAYNNSLGYYHLAEDNPNLRYGDAVGRGSVLANMGTLTIDSSNFTDNYAGEKGGAIYNEGNLTVNNSLFGDNFANVYGGAISSTYHVSYNPYNIYDSQVQINNSIFENNQVILPLNIGDVTGGGALSLINTKTNIDNCTFNNNSATTPITGLMGVSAHGGSIASEQAANTVTNASIYINNSNFTNHGTKVIDNGKSYYHGLNGSITNCIFENNQGSIKDYGNLNITNNTFKNITNADAVIYNSYEVDIEKTIKDNLFQDNNVTFDTIYTITGSNYNNNIVNFTVKNNTYLNTTINDTITLNIPSKIYNGEAITITGTYSINNPDDFDENIKIDNNYDENILEQNKFNIYINGVLDQTVDTLEFTVTPTGGNTILTVQPTISQTRKTAILREITPSNITITPENYDEYIYEGVLVGVERNSNITFNGTFTDKEEIYIDTDGILLDGSQATFTNTEFTLDAENITIQNMKITNTETTSPIANYQAINKIANNTITLTNTETSTSAIFNGADNTLIENNTIIMQAPAIDVDFSTGSGVASTQAILLLNGDKNTVQNNSINITCTQATGYNTLEAITNSNGATNTLITKNTININGANFNYAIDCLNNIENITITENTILVTGQRYCDGVQVGNGAENIVINNNNITCICLNTTPLTEEGAITYGVIGTSMGSFESKNITINENNINLTGQVNYAIELYKVNKTEIHDNNITVNGPFSLGIGYSYAPNGNATNNTIIINGDSTTPINYITEEIKPENTGLRVQNGTQNINLQNNTIITSDMGGQDTTIHTDESTVTIKNNKLISSQGYGHVTIKTFNGANIEENIINTIATLTTTNINTTINSPTTITVTVTDEFGGNINTGLVTFTDTNGNTLATADVTDAIATATVTFTTPLEDTITATYISTNPDLNTSSDITTITISKEANKSITIDDVNAVAGQTITLTARLYDENGVAITGGKVTFKVNGKTLKDANGKVIYAKVVDGVATAEYTVPDNLADNQLNIQAVYSGSAKYDKANATLTTTVTPKELTLTASDVTAASGSTVQLTATLSDNTINNGKIVFKINGKTVKDANGKVVYVKVANGTVIVEYTIPENMKAGDYIITAIYMPTAGDRLESNAVLTVIKA
ncbi:MAG: Ig-like domain repeat protein [Methanosphaera sp.]|nr:Ig-like domain repeat protein [Methanosphaera sp.]